MSLPMTIHEARQLQDTDLAVDENSVAQAEREASEAEEAAATLERSAVEGGNGSAAPGAVIEARAVAEFARQRAGRVRVKADRARAARRLLDLDQVGNDVQALAAAVSKPSKSVEAAVRKIAEGRAELLRLCADHDQQVSALMQRAHDLSAEKPAPSGPRASSAHVTLTGSVLHDTAGIQSGSAVVRRISQAQAAQAAVTAAEGKPDEAIARLQAARFTEPPKAADRYYFLSSGSVSPFNDQDPILASQAAKGQVRFLTAEQRDAYLDGRLDGYHDQT